MAKVKKVVKKVDKKEKLRRDILMEVQEYSGALVDMVGHKILNEHGKDKTCRMKAKKSFNKIALMLYELGK